MGWLRWRRDLLVEENCCYLLSQREWLHRLGSTDLAVLGSPTNRIRITRFWARESSETRSLQCQRRTCSSESDKERLELCACDKDVYRKASSVRGANGIHVPLTRDAHLIRSQGDQRSHSGSRRATVLQDDRRPNITIRDIAPRR